MRKRRSVVAAENRSSHATAQAEREMALVKQDARTKGLVPVAGPVSVRITRCSRQPISYNELVGGSQALCDAIASLIRRPGHGLSAGITFDYCQRQTAGKPYTEIKVFKA